MKPAVFKLLRATHRWAGVFFAPLIVLFALSGLLQTIEADDRMPGWAMQAWDAIEQAHTEQALRDRTNLHAAATIVIAAMGAALIGCTLIGVVLAYAMYPRHRARTTLVLAMGVIVPLIVLLV